jgi:hypothetical protein
MPNFVDAALCARALAGFHILWAGAVTAEAFDSRRDATLDLPVR